MTTERATGVARPAAAGLAILNWVERRVGLTPSGVGLVAIAAVGWTAARLIGSRALFLMTYGLLVVLGVSWFLGRRRLGVEAGRSELPTRVREGQLVDVELELKATRRVTTIVLEEELHRHLGTTVRVPVPLLPAGEDVHHRYSFTPRVRGVFEVGPLLASWSDPFGLTRRTTVLAEPARIIVHPTTEPVHDRVLSREWEDPPIRPPDSKPWPTGFEFYGMRDYVSGDDPRRIVWRATARYMDIDDPSQDRYLVRESEQGITDRVGLVLDTERAHHSPGDPSETFEAAVRTIASLGSKHIKDGFGVTVDTNAARIADQLRGQINRIRLLDALAYVQPGREPLTALLDRLLVAPRTDTHMVVVTPHVDNAVATRIRLLIGRGTSVLLVHVVWMDTDPLSLHRAGSLGTNVVEVSARTPLGAAFRKVVAAGSRRVV